MNRYTFKVELSGFGETPDEAWEAVIENTVFDNPEVISIENIDEN